MTIHDVLSDGLSLSISQSCQAPEVSRSGYYKWRIQPEIAPTDLEDVDLKNQRDRYGIYWLRLQEDDCRTPKPRL